MTATSFCIIFVLSDEKRTVVLVAHRLSTVINADQIVVIDGGRAIERGKHNELLERKGVYFNLIQKQLRNNSTNLDSYDLDKNDKM